MKWRQVPPATDDEIRDYVRGVEKGTLKSATVNVVASLLRRIAEDKKLLQRYESKVGQCAGCGTVLYDGDTYRLYADGVYHCVKCEGLG